MKRIRVQEWIKASAALVQHTIHLKSNAQWTHTKPVTKGEFMQPTNQDAFYNSTKQKGAAETYFTLSCMRLITWLTCSGAAVLRSWWTCDAF